MNQMGDHNYLGQFIPLHYHYQMLLDKARMSGFQQALQVLVKPEAKVVDLGGGTGVLSYFAAQRASKVYCVELNPQMAAAAKSFLAANTNGARVEVIVADAMQFVPPEPVDLVICEMLHSGLLREKQIAVLESFKTNYMQCYPTALPACLPEATILAIQPVEQEFNFHGYQAPVPIFFDPTGEQQHTRGLADPTVYAMLEYRKPLPSRFTFQQSITISQPGVFNAFRFITKNILAILLDSNSTIDWHNFYLILPLATPFQVVPGETFAMSFDYNAGDQIDTLLNSLQVVKC